MRLAVADEHAAILVHPQAVQPRELALERVAVRAVALGAGAGDEFERAALHVHHADAVALGVGEIHVAIGRDGDALRAGQRRLLRRASVAGKTLLPRARDVLNLPGLEVELEDLVSLTRGEPEIAGGVEIQRARPVERRAGDG